VHFYDEGGGLHRLPMAWTDLKPADDFAVAAQGRARFCPDDLAALAALVDALRAARDVGTPTSDVSN
jgi:hypothetical protein